MCRRIRLVFMVVVLMGLQACTVAYTSLNGKLEESPQKEVVSCNIPFSLELVSSFHTNTFGTERVESKREKERKGKYIEATKRALQEISCSSSLIESSQEPMLIIKLRNQPNISALPQEWLTGLSLGIIPSWGTRKAEYVYTFSGPRLKEHTYTVDSTSINHIYLMPIFWVSYFTYDEVAEYKDAVINYVKNKLLVENN